MEDTMAWISVTAARSYLAEGIAQHRALRAATGVVAFADMYVVWAWIAGDAEAIREEQAILMHPTHLTPKMLARPSETLLLSLAASLLLRRCAGEDVDKELKRLAHLKGYREKAPQIVQAALERVLSGKKPAGRARKIGYPETEEEFKKLSERVPPPIPAQLALVPDGPLWGRLSGTVIPLAYEALSSSGARPDLESLGAFIHSGAGSRERDVVYERTGGGVPSGVWRKDPIEVPGFDAVELTEEAVIVHHYMGVRWQAPLLFDEDVNAFQFLKHVEAGWDQVRETIGSEAWSRLVRARAERRTVHRISIDPENAMEDAVSTERARKTYGVEIEVVSFLDA
ncbi:hypothetical protein [Sorangium sp. So ce887]|uniref:hypothetical protein n=1 Tax=Sorangium sp. So ce887 TaxID=3133324 RepID=UPI003F629679